MDYLREGIHLRAMAQKDPLVEYRAEGHAMFEELGGAIREEVVTLLSTRRSSPARTRTARAMQPAERRPGSTASQYQHQTIAGADAIAAAGTAATASRWRRRRGVEQRVERSRRRSAATTRAGAAAARSSRSATAPSAFRLTPRRLTRR